MTPVNYLTLGPLLLLVAFGVAAPHLSALLTRVPGYLTGVLTTLVAAIGGFLTQWVEQDHGYDWKRGLYNTLFAWLVGLGIKGGWLVRTGVAARLHAAGPQLGDGPPRNDVGRTTIGNVIGVCLFVAALVLLLSVHWIAALVTVAVGVVFLVYV